MDKEIKSLSGKLFNAAANLNGNQLTKVAANCDLSLRTVSRYVSGVVDEVRNVQTANKILSALKEVL